MFRKLMLLTLCMAAIVGCVAIIKGSSVPVLFYQAMGTHNQQTLKAAEDNVVKQRQTAAASMQNAAKTGDDVVTAAKEVAENPDSKAVSKLDQTVSTYMKNVDQASRQREGYDAQVATLREEIQYAEEHWSEIIEKMTDPAIKQEHQRTHDRMMRSLQRKLQSVEKELHTFDVALARAANAELAAESLKQYAVMGTLAGKLDGFVFQVREANSAMTHAANALLATLHTDDTVTEVAGS
jgi:predicted  nucleic acid-binding Zn-ribbon protein